MHNHYRQSKHTEYKLVTAEGERGCYSERPARIIAWLLANGVWFRLYRGDELIDSN